MYVYRGPLLQENDEFLRPSVQFVLFPFSVNCLSVKTLLGNRLMLSTANKASVLKIVTFSSSLFVVLVTLFARLYWLGHYCSVKAETDSSPLMLTPQTPLSVTVCISLF